MIAFYRSPGFLPAIIRWMNFSDRNHVSYIDADEVTEFEAAMYTGVHKRNFLDGVKDGTQIDLFSVDLTAGEVLGLREFFTSELGQPYDWRGLGGFPLRREVEDPDAWFCSELIAAGFIAIQKPLLLRIEPFKTYPALLSYSPLLKFVRTVKIGGAQ